MASSSSSSSKAFLLSTSMLISVTLLVISLHFSTVNSSEFAVGGGRGWVVPPAKNSDYYNDWASRNRFKVNDTLSFKFGKDSVMVVDEGDYKKCKSVHPLFFSNNGNHTVYTLDRPDLFYFISGVSGHCEKGLKMIIKVLDTESPHHSANDRSANGAISSLSSSHSIHVTIFILAFFQAVFM
ncbi:OLC1v1023957C1 [Oldenlandia corymbosa var. corymbosa]|uniref:OLC1v1023957C1 n=1 Tax=Oldenlandia corymbosa var. corymbosa TaxID=529605 RepID=A0AAV1C230_OLDCO|nr:OLC1v1023957C1 [Oldenlandia corymbosa var. corymbosa]